MRKFIKKLSDWKIWLFMILPIILLIIWLSIMIYCCVNSLYNATLIIGVQVLFPVAIILMSCDTIFKGIKQKHYLRGIASVALMVCFLGLQIASMVMLPKLIELSQEEENLYQIYKETSYGDASHEELQDAWREANREVSNLSFTLQLINSGSYVAVVVFNFCRPHVKQKSNDDNNESDNNNLVCV